MLYLVVYFLIFKIVTCDNSTTRYSNDINRFRDDEIQWTNINEEIDMALVSIWPVMVEKGYTRLKLSDVDESVSVKPLFFTYKTRFLLTNGILDNVKGISRSGDSFMTYNNKSFLIKTSPVVEYGEFTYDFTVNFMSFHVSGQVVGILRNILSTGEFSISAENAHLKLNDFEIKSLGDMQVRLNLNPLLSTVSSIFLTPLTSLFERRIASAISGGISDQLVHLMKDINDKDQLKLKSFVKDFAGHLIGPEL